MLDTALAREPTASVPPLAWSDDLGEPPPLDALARKALGDRPELASARADRRRALAEVDVMRSMYGPMALVRAGPAYMMSEGTGMMAMVGISIPIWRESLGAGVSEAKAMAAMASADIDAMERMFVGNIAIARESVLAERTRLLAIQQDILPRARQVVASATGSFAAGQGPMLPVLDAARDLREIRMQEIMARTRLSTAWARLRRETAGLSGTTP
jgi:outer membrane protein TolC